MQYRRIQTSRPPPLFELQFELAFGRLNRRSGGASMPPPHMLGRLRQHLQSLLLAENLPPLASSLALLINSFVDLAKQTAMGEPVVQRKRRTLSLLFDVFALQSEMSLDDPDELILGYTQSMMGFLLLAPAPRRIGMIGLGGGSLAKFCYRHLPDSVIETAEIDPRVIALRERFCIPPDDARMQVHCLDGADFVRDASQRFDVLLVDGFDRQGQPPQLCSQRFYDDCYQALTADGVMVVNLLGDALETSSSLERMERAFGGALVVIDALDSVNTIAFACKGQSLHIDEKTLMQRVGQTEILHPMLLMLMINSILAARAQLRSAPERPPWSSATCAN